MGHSRGAGEDFGHSEARQLSARNVLQFRRSTDIVSPLVLA